MKNLQEGQKVEFSLNGSEKRIGTIRGIASNGLAFLGKTYIIEPDIPLDKSIYPYSHFVLFESQLFEIE